MAGWLIGHPEFNSLFKVGCLWNPVLNMSYMVQATDITDWIVSCNQNRQFDSMVYNEKDNDCFFQKSPFSVVQNVSCPTLLVVGSKDLRSLPTNLSTTTTLYGKRGWQQSSLCTQRADTPFLKLNSIRMQISILRLGSISISDSNKQKKKTIHFSKGKKIIKNFLELNLYFFKIGSLFFFKKQDNFFSLFWISRHPSA